jgi:uncharacterized membrane protein
MNENSNEKDVLLPVLNLADSLATIKASLTVHVGSLPPPEAVERYEQVMPGSFDRILTRAEQEQQNKFEHNRTILAVHEHDVREGWKFAHCGQFFAFFLIVIYFSLLGLTIWFDSLTMFATVIGAGALAGLPALVRSFQNKGKNKQDS